MISLVLSDETYGNNTHDVLTRYKADAEPLGRDREAGHHPINQRDTRLQDCGLALAIRLVREKISWKRARTLIARLKFREIIGFHSRKYPP